MDYKILVINPGSTSTKIALYKNEEELFNENVVHPQEEIDKFSSLVQEIPMRQKHVLEALERHGYKAKDLSIVMGRGGLFPPIKSGGYKVNQTMLDLVLGEKIQPAFIVYNGDDTLENDDFSLINWKELNQITV